MDAAAFARRLWPLLEPIHAVVYFAPELAAAAEQVGVPRPARYFALRAAPLGAVGAEAVGAIFYGFAPDRVSAALPQVWTAVDPAAVLQARGVAVEAALDRLLAGIRPGHLETAADLVFAAAARIDDLGARPLTASNRRLLVAEASPSGRLWQAATTLREHRGEGHSIALAHDQVGPIEAHLLRAAAGQADLAFLQATRGWSDTDTGRAGDGLRGRGWLDDEGALTGAGRAGRARYEAATDRLAQGPWLGLDEAEREQIETVLRPVAEQVVANSGPSMLTGLGSPWPPPGPD